MKRSVTTVVQICPNPFLPTQRPPSTASTCRHLLLRAVIGKRRGTYAARICPAADGPAIDERSESASVPLEAPSAHVRVVFPSPRVRAHCRRYEFGFGSRISISRWKTGSLSLTDEQYPVGCPFHSSRSTIFGRGTRERSSIRPTKRSRPATPSPSSGRRVTALRPRRARGGRRRRTRHRSRRRAPRPRDAPRLAARGESGRRLRAYEPAPRGRVGRPTRPLRTPVRNAAGNHTAGLGGCPSARGLRPLIGRRYSSSLTVVRRRAPSAG